MAKKLDEITLRSEEIQQVLTKVPHWMVRWGSVLFLVLIIMILALTWLVKYPDVISSAAIITTQIPPQKEYARVTGEIDTLLIRNNETVVKGQPLAVVENTANFEDVQLLKSIMDTIVINNVYFTFPLERLPILFLGDIEADFALFENSYIQYSLNSELQPFSNEALASQISISELNGRLKNLESQKDINAKELLFKKKDLDRNATLFEKGVISAIDFENKQLEYLQTERNYKNMSVLVSQVREEIGNAGKNSKGIAINKKREEIMLLKSVIQSFNALKKSIKDWERHYVFEANIYGKVAFLNYWAQNQTVTQGDLVFIIVPANNTNYIAKLKTPAQNSGKIKIGQKVLIRLENYPDSEFGTLTGEIQNISLLPNKEGLYLIDVQLPEKLLTSYNEEIQFTQEMLGKAEIITEDLRLIERLLYSLKDAFIR